MQNRSSEPPSERLTLTRGSDRRHNVRALVPPYITGEGLVLVDRRSNLDRRAGWVRDFSIDFAHWNKS